MTGAHCSIVGCTTSRYKKKKDIEKPDKNFDENIPPDPENIDVPIGIFKLPCSKPRDEDSTFKNMIAKGNI